MNVKSNKLCALKSPVECVCVRAFQIASKPRVAAPAPPAPRAASQAVRSTFAAHTKHAPLTMSMPMPRLSMPGMQAAHEKPDENNAMRESDAQTTHVVENTNIYINNCCVTHFLGTRLIAFEPQSPPK